MSHVLTDAKLERILALAMIGAYARWTWFHGCTYKRPIIFCPDHDLTVTLRKCFLPQIQTVIADCQILDLDTTPVRTAYRGEMPNKGRLDGLD